MIGLASSIPQFNLKEVNNAIIHLINNPDCSFEDIYCAPDFATGAYLLNEEEVKESLRVGNGFSCRLRSSIEYDDKDRCLIVTEIPYGVYTNTICKELEAILEDDFNPGIERFNDLTGKNPLIKIYLSKKSNPDRVLRYLYKNTSLQSWYSINMTMLKDGKYPKVFGWKEALEEFVKHENIVYRRGFEFDLKKIKNRIHIIEGFLICLANIDEVVKIIKESSSVQSANKNLCNNFLLDDEQAKAVLDMKLSRLARLEVQKLKDEKILLEKKSIEIQEILDSQDKLNSYIIKDLQSVANKYGDNRRTKLLNLAVKENEVIEEKEILINLTNFSNLYISETSTLMQQRRGGIGNKVKLKNGEYILDTINTKNNSNIMLFSNIGRYYNYDTSKFTLEGKISIYDILSLNDGEKISKIISYDDVNKYKYIIFITKNGLIKKSLLKEYKTKRVDGATGIKIKDNDEIVSINFMNEEPIGVLSSKGRMVIFETNNISEVGKLAYGVKGMRLDTNDYVVDAHPILSEDKEICTVTKNGLVVRTSLNEINITNRDTKGIIIQKVSDDDSEQGFISYNKLESLLLITTNTIIKIPENSINLTGRGAIGVHGIKLKTGDSVIGILL